VVQGAPHGRGTGTRSRSLRDQAGARPGGGGAGPRGGSAGGRRGRSGEHVRVRHEQRAVADGYSSELLPGVRASEDARRLADELAFSNGRLLALAAAPPGMYGELRELAAGDRERAAWGCLLIAYLGPLEEREGGDPFAAIRTVFLAGGPRGPLPDLDGVASGPRGSHDASRGGGATLEAYSQWLARAGAEDPYVGDPGWSAERRFARTFERLALPGLTRAARYELLVTLGGLGIYELRADSLQLGGGARGVPGDDLTTQGAKRLFAIGDPLLLERRAEALARAAGVPLEAHDLAIANWAAGERATLGVPSELVDLDALERARSALALPTSPELD